MPEGFFPQVVGRPGGITITPWSHQSIGTELFTSNNTNPAPVAWLAAGLTEFVPFVVPEAMVITKLLMGIGVAAGNIDIGIFDEAGNLLVGAGTTLVTAASNLQVADVTDTKIERGRYYMAGVADTVTTLTIFRVAPAAGICQSFGLLEQAGITLPLSTGANPATFAKYTRAHVPLVGLQGYRAVGP